MTTPTDWRALCAELLEALKNAIRVIYNEDGTKHISTADHVISKADTALAQSEPQGPTDDAELRTTYAIGAEARWREGFSEAWSLTDMERAAHTAGLRAVLARFGRPAIKPVPVAERLPGPEDCDSEGRCWTYDGKHVPAGYAGDWTLRHAPNGGNWVWRNVTHWLPHWALPVPTP